MAFARALALVFAAAAPVGAGAILFSAEDRHPNATADVTGGERGSQSALAPASPRVSVTDRGRTGPNPEAGVAGSRSTPSAGSPVTTAVRPLGRTTEEATGQGAPPGLGREPSGDLRPTLATISNAAKRPAPDTSVSGASPSAPRPSPPAKPTASVAFLVPPLAGLDSAFEGSQARTFIELTGEGSFIAAERLNVAPFASLWIDGCPCGAGISETVDAAGIRRIRVEGIAPGEYRGIVRATVDRRVLAFSEPFVVAASGSETTVTTAWWAERADVARVKAGVRSGDGVLPATFRALVEGARCSQGQFDARYATSGSDGVLAIPANRDVVVQVVSFPGDIDLGLPPPRTVNVASGQVLDVTFDPPEAVETTIRASGPDGRAANVARVWLVRFPDGGSPRPCRCPSVTAGGAVRFSLPPGRYGAHVRSDAGGRAWREFVVGKGPTRVDVTVRSEGAVLRAILLDHEGKPLWTGVSLRPWSATGPADELFWAGPTDPKTGLVTSDPLPAGEYVVQVRGWWWKRVVLRGRDEPVETWTLPKEYAGWSQHLVSIAGDPGAAQGQELLAERSERPEEWGRVGRLPWRGAWPFERAGRGDIWLSDGTWKLTVLPTWGGEATRDGAAHGGGSATVVVAKGKPFEVGLSVAPR